MSEKRIFYTGCVFRTDILDRVVFLFSEKFYIFRQGSGFEHQVGTYPYENDRSTPPPHRTWRAFLSERIYNFWAAGKFVNNICNCKVACSHKKNHFRTLAASARTANKIHLNIQFQFQFHLLRNSAMCTKDIK